MSASAGSMRFTTGGESWDCCSREALSQTHVRGGLLTAAGLTATAAVLAWLTTRAPLGPSTPKAERLRPARHGDVALASIAWTRTQAHPRYAAPAAASPLVPLPSLPDGLAARPHRLERDLCPVPHPDAGGLRHLPGVVVADLRRGGRLAAAGLPTGRPLVDALRSVARVASGSRSAPRGLRQFAGVGLDAPRRPAVAGPADLWCRCPCVAIVERQQYGPHGPPLPRRGRGRDGAL